MARRAAEIPLLPYLTADVKSAIIEKRYRRCFIGTGLIVAVRSLA